MALLPFPLPLLLVEEMLLQRVITDKLGSCGTTKKQAIPKVEHRSHKGLNNRAQNSHVPLRFFRRLIKLT